MWPFDCAVANYDGVLLSSVAKFYHYGLVQLWQVDATALSDPDHRAH